MAIDNPDSASITPPSKIRARWIHIYLPENGYVPGDSPAAGEELPRFLVDLVGCEPEMDGESQAVNGATRLKWTDDVRWTGSVAIDEGASPGLLATHVSKFADVLGSADTLLGDVHEDLLTLHRREQLEV